MNLSQLIKGKGEKNDERIKDSSCHSYFYCCFNVGRGSNERNYHQRYTYRQNKPHVYISFEREGKLRPLRTGESNRGVWLRFHNNSIWDVGICMSDVPEEYGDAELDYEVERYEDIEGSSEKPLSTNPEGSCSIVPIGPGKSILFSVPREHLAEGLAIRVRFIYEWEFDADVYNDGWYVLKHYAYLYSSDIPKKQAIYRTKKYEGKRPRRTKRLKLSRL